jgi:hypothetical protein
MTVVHLLSEGQRFFAFLFSAVAFPLPDKRLTGEALVTLFRRVVAPGNHSVDADGSKAMRALSLWISLC